MQTDPVCVGTCHSCWRGAHRQITRRGCYRLMESMFFSHSPPVNWAHPSILAIAGISVVTSSGWNRSPSRPTSQQGAARPCLGDGSMAQGSCCLRQLCCWGPSLSTLSLPCPGVGAEGVGGQGPGEQVRERATPRKIREQNLAGWKPGPRRSGNSPKPPGEGGGEERREPCLCRSLPSHSGSFSEHLP